MSGEEGLPSNNTNHSSNNTDNNSNTNNTTNNDNIVDNSGQVCGDFTKSGTFEEVEDFRGDHLSNTTCLALLV